MSFTNKGSRLEQLELILKSHPDGLRRSDIARRLGVHRSTAGRYIMELSEENTLWEDNFRIGINESRSSSTISFSLTENFSIQMAIQSLNAKLDHHHTHLVAATRKLALAMEQQYPVTSEKMFKMAEEMDNYPIIKDRDMASYFENLADAIENKNEIDLIYLNKEHKARILPEELTINHSSPLSKALRISGKCSVTGNKCSFFLHNIEMSKEKHLANELSKCPFTNGNVKDTTLLKLKVFNPSVIDLFSTITENGFIIEESSDGSCTVQLLVSLRKDLKKKLMQMGSDIEVLYPNDIRNTIKREIETIAEKYQDSSEEKSAYKEDTGEEESFADIKIREMHHRIKNQLISITSFISLYSNKSAGKSDISILDEVNSKITTISIVHDMLAAGGSWPVLSVSDFIKELCINLINSMEVKKEIEFYEEMIEIYLPEDQIIIIGFIIAELCINSLKHAFVNKNRGKISVILTKENEVKTIIFKDNGRGMEKYTDESLSAGTGHNLVDIFVNQLRGSIEYDSKNGTEIIITFV